MGYDGTGHFTRLFSWQAEEAAGNGIVSDDHDSEDDNFANGLNNAFCRDGQAPATGPFNMAGQKIGNLGPATLDGDAVPLGQVTGSGAYPPLDWKKAINMVGADANGRLNFMSSTGVNGIAWYGADLSWLARLKDTDKVTNRLVLNNSFLGTGTDVIVCDDWGNISGTSLMFNLSQDPDGDIRTIAPGWGARFVWQADGKLAYQSNKTATATDQYVAAPLDDRFTIEGKDGDSWLTLNKDATGDQFARISGTKGGVRRWEIDLGTSHAESSTRTGSNFYINAYNNDGSAFGTPFYIMRDSGQVGLPYGIYGTLTVNGGIVYTNNVSCIGSNPLILGGNMVYLRPQGYASGAGQMYIEADGSVAMHGIKEHSSTVGSFGSQDFNFLYVAADDIRCYVDDQLRGYFTPACDYRIKQDVKPLTSTWDKIKALRPVSFKHRDFVPAAKGKEADDRERWGFIAHELQEDLIETAATLHKDAEDDAIEIGEDGKERVIGKRAVMQGPNIMTVVAALTAALQEAQLRIEALEAKLA